ncbi:MAG TPA: oxygen-dependent coproporphyrinogen oxidase [Kofleriaceae bacterium]|nr:oxygen-dependent coproporphyrinogen oxidase [Kofleriaceae bacterium]
MSDLFDRAAKFFSALQTDICRALAEADGAVAFISDAWQRPAGGGGVTRILEAGALFEKAGVSWSAVEGELPAELADHMPGDGRQFRACGLTIALHPRSPMVPAMHASLRCVARGRALWFGGGADLTPYYLFHDDAVHFHAALAAVCDRHRPVADYDRFKAQGDEYFFLPHRKEARGIGGVFFDYLGGKGEHPAEQVLDFVRALGGALAAAYLPIVHRRQPQAFGELERTWQLRRRARLAEFHMVYDRGTVFGLKTDGRAESILMALPPMVRWDYDVMATPGSPEAELLAHLRPIDWLRRKI